MTEEELVIPKILVTAIVASGMVSGQDPNTVSPWTVVHASKQITRLIFDEYLKERP